MPGQGILKYDWPLGGRISNLIKFKAPPNTTDADRVTKVRQALLHFSRHQAHCGFINLFVDVDRHSVNRYVTVDNEKRQTMDKGP